VFIGLLILLESSIALVNLVTLGRRFLWTQAVAWTDFTAYWTAWWMVLHGRGAALYDRAAQESAQRALLPGVDLGGAICVFLYPPHAAIVGLPLGVIADHFGEPVAFAVWTGVNVVLLARVIWLCRDELGARGASAWLVAAWVLAFFPVVRDLSLGQVSLVLAWAALGLVRAVRDGREGAAAGWLTVFTIKPQLLPALVIWLISRRRYRVLALAGGLGVVLVIASAIVLGPGIWLDYVRRVPGLESYFAAPLEMPNVRAALLRALPLRPHAAELGAYAAWLVSLAALAWASLRHRLIDSQSFALSLMVGLVFDPHLFHQDLVIAIVPLTLHVAASRERGEPWRGLATLALAWPLVYLLGRLADLTATPAAPFRTPIDPVLVMSVAVVAAMAASSRRAAGPVGDPTARRLD
jgi:Glycosyltransferase family 87